MDARLYFRLSDAIFAARSFDDLAVVRQQVVATEMHPMERRTLERVLQARTEALSHGDAAVPLPPVTRAD
jgi:hypothetical protein